MNKNTNMKFPYILYSFFLFVDFIKTYNYSTIITIQDENSLINNSVIYSFNLSFPKKINNTLFNCANLENGLISNRKNDSDFLCLKYKKIYVLDKSDKILNKKNFNDFLYNPIEIFEESKNKDIISFNKRNYNKNELKDNTKRKVNEDSIKCSKIDEISLKNNICIECNIEQGYFPIINNYNPNKKYKVCHKYETNKGENNLLGYYFDSNEKGFKKCHENCLSCKEPGNDLINNCITCKDGYIKSPGINSTTNCAKDCDYYYYYTLTGNYLCTEDFYCPNEASNLIQTENKCINNCTENNIYKKQYNGICYEYCPENTEFNESLNKCVDTNLNKCSITVKEIKINITHLNFNTINTLVKNYANEFHYTLNHISVIYSNENYSIAIYKNKSCLNDLNTNNSKISYEILLQKINDIYNIINPIVVIIDRIGKYGHPWTYFAFYNPDNGDKLDTSFCDNTTYIIQKNISNIYEKEKYDWLVNQGVDIYNIINLYYLSPCFEYKEKQKINLLPKDRLLYHYPNISLCDLNCVYNGTNYATLITECICVYNDTNYTSFNYTLNLLTDDIIKNKQDYIFEFVYNKTLVINDLLYLLCFKNFFKFKYFATNIEGYIFLILYIIDIICVILIIKNNFFKKINNFLLLITESYINYLKRKKIIKNKGKHEKNKNLIKKEKSNENNSYSNTEPEKNNKIKEEEKTTNNILKSLISNEGKTNLKESSSKKETISKEKTENDETTTTMKKSIRKRNTIGLINQNSVSEKLNDLEEKDKNIFDRENYISEEEMKKYLILSPEEMDYYEALEKDKRTFLNMTFNLIVEKNIIVHTFLSSEETEPIYIRIIIFVFFLLNIAVSFCLYISKDISNLYYTSIKKYLYNNIITNSVLCFLIDGIKNLFTIFLINKDSIREIMKREKKDIYLMKKSIIKFIGCIKLRYCIFIIINLIYVLLSFYITPIFNSAYPQLKGIWLISYLIMIIVIQFIYVFLAVLIICLRFIALKCKYKLIFTFSKYLNEFL